MPERDNNTARGGRGKKAQQTKKDREPDWGLGGCERVKMGEDSGQEAAQAGRRGRLELEEDEGRRGISPITVDNSR